MSPAPAGRESAADRRKRARRVVDLLTKEYPDAHCELTHQSPYQLLAATILSAQCTDVRVNLVTPALFARYPTPADLAEAERPELEALIRSTGFFRNKAKSLIGMARALVQHHGGEVPSTMEELRVLPGVGRKTANVILGNAFAINAGVTVDTHVARLSRLLRWTRQNTPEAIERDLMALIPQEEWALLSHLLIWHGRRICIARRPRCADCVVNRYCPSRQDLPSRRPRAASASRSGRGTRRSAASP